jgi:hypothetical protein
MTNEIEGLAVKLDKYKLLANESDYKNKSYSIE